jgi:hypothetical protein
VVAVAGEVDVVDVLQQDVTVGLGLGDVLGLDQRRQPGPVAVGG